MMRTEQKPYLLLFPPFRLDPANERLWRGARVVSLRRKSLAVLHYLVERPGALVTREELLNALWPGTCVSDSAIKGCIRELRKVLGDSRRTAKFIETVQGRGYRFIGKVVRRQHPVAGVQEEARDWRLGASALPPRISSPQPLVPQLVGRTAELAQLQRWLENALSGERQIVFVTGEPGIGKTTLVDAFVQRLAADRALHVSRGQCVAHYGSCEAYLPVLDALGRLCRESGGEPLIAVLKQYAPTWLVQMPWLLSEGELEEVQRKMQGATRERMLRELAEAVEAITTACPLVLVLEDLQWSDSSTLDLLSFFAQRREAARLLMIGTYRPSDVHFKEHPLQIVKQELQTHGQCRELPLRLLGETEVAEYLQARFASPPRSVDERQGEVVLSSGDLQRLARLVHQRTDGNPLFMVHVVDDLLARGVVADSQPLEEALGRIPESLQQLIDQQCKRLSRAEQRVLEAASVAGMDFTAAAIAAGLGEDMLRVEETCEELVCRTPFLHSRGTREWPDGTVSAQYGFVHALYQEALYKRLPAGKRALLHRRVGERLEQGHGAKMRDIAAELAVHFEHGRDYQRAVYHRQQAARNATWRCALPEAISHLRKGLELLRILPDTPERTQQELCLLIGLGSTLQGNLGIAAPEAENVFLQAQQLCRRLESPRLLFEAVRGLQNFYQMRGELQRARELAEQLLEIAEQVEDPLLFIPAHFMLATALLSLGELTSAKAHLEQGISLYDSQAGLSLPLENFSLATYYALACLSRLAAVLLSLGYPEQALRKSQEALVLAWKQSHPYSLAWTLHGAAELSFLRQEWQSAWEQAEALIALATKHGFVEWAAMGTILRGAVLTERGEVEEGMVQLQAGLSAYQTTGAVAGLPWYSAVLAKAYGKMRQVEKGLTLLADALALARNRRQCLAEASLYWLQGELLLEPPKASIRDAEANAQDPAPSALAAAEECLQQAIAMARQKSAKWLELHATLGFCRLRQQQGRGEEARQMLAEIYGWFTEGFDTAALQEARALLEGLE